ncbi:MAG: hypothetical protein KKG53_08420 [Proteobacteria bacterium]|nr:hypothetical protein [Pseudomonadota bacterium]
MTCIALPLLTAQFLHQIYRLHLALVAIPAFIIPAGYIYFAQAYYHGGKNEQYQLHITIFFILMCLLGVVYLYSLFVITPKEVRAEGAEAEAEGGEAEQEAKFGYEITLYNLDSEGQRGAMKLQEQGEDELPDYITVDGFSKNIAISLHEYWEAYLDNDLDEYSTDVTTYETIVKFGEPMQLVDKYQLVLKIT